MRVYRMEHAKIKCGPWRDLAGVISAVDTKGLNYQEKEALIQFHDAWSEKFDNDDNPLEYHPFPHDDGISFQEGFDICGCASLESILDWFGDCLDPLKRAGFIINVYEVDNDDCKLGDYQIAFYRSNNTPIVETIPL